MHINKWKNWIKNIEYFFYCLKNLKNKKGKPGSGKTKICENVSLDFPVSTINIDEAINNEINNNTNLGKELEEYKNNNSEIPNVNMN